jgi:uncharacterized membrane protein YgcG
MSSGGVDKQGSRSAMTLSVPSDTLDRVLDELGKLGTTVQRSSSARDVTSTYVDTQARITTMKASLDQLRALLAKTTDLNQIISLETEISRRQADLDALQAQLNALDRKVTMSTVSVTLVTAANVVVPEDTSGFLGGLRAGWKAFLAASSGALTVLGAILPFVALLAIVAVPLLWWRRRRSAGQEPKPAYASWTPPTGSAGPGTGTGPGGGSGGSGGPEGRPGGSGDPGGAEAPDQTPAASSSEPSGKPVPSTSAASSESLDGSASEPEGGTGPREPETAGAGAR